MVNVAGGRGGQRGNRPNDNCRPDRLMADAGALAPRSRRVPTLWIYTANDTFFAPAIARGMHAAYTAAGGEAELRILPPWGNDGHDMFYGPGGSDSWGPIVQAFLTAHP
ncbi:hypothetical protein ACE7GA_23060 [Roseomonas sp. CCTCC AB2023176]|uniref:hypothetical protein n=1 Tax=Roseomonas sp. CCTCC AB2023176 TaxID=3342640 RepID=UPI0035DD57C4